MRKVMLLAAILATLGMASQAADARDRSFGFRGFSAHAGAKLHLRDGGLKFDRPGRFGKPRHFKPRHFGHFGHRDFAFKFGDGGLMLKFGHVPHFKPHPFGHGHHGPFFKFGRPRHFEPLHRRGFAFGKKPRHFRSGHLMGFHDSSWGFEPRPHGAVPGPGSFEVVLKQLEEQGFRHVTRLLREGAPGTP